MPPASLGPSVPAARVWITTVPVSFTGTSGSSVPWTSRRSLPMPPKKLRTSIVLFAPFVENLPSTNWTVPKLIPPGKVAGSPNVCGLPLEYEGPKSRSVASPKPVSDVEVRTPERSCFEPSLKMFRTSICFDSGGCVPILNSGPSF